MRKQNFHMVIELSKVAHHVRACIPHKHDFDFSKKFWSQSVDNYRNNFLSNLILASSFSMKSKRTSTWSAAMLPSKYLTTAFIPRESTSRWICLGRLTARFCMLLWVFWIARKEDNAKLNSSRRQSTWTKCLAASTETSSQSSSWKASKTQSTLSHVCR